MKRLFILIALSLPIISFGQEAINEPNRDLLKAKHQDDFSDKASRSEIIVAKFPGDINEYISKKTHYPKAAKKNNIQGLVTLSFLVDTFGNVINVKVEKGIGFGCDEEAVRVVKAMPKWSPATQNGNPVKMYYNLNIRFSLPWLKKIFR